jgi:transposase-like protein
MSQSLRDELPQLLGLKKPQNVTPKRIARQQKQAEFLKLLFQGHITFAEAARQIGIGRRQAYRWFAKWKEDEGLEIDREWWQLYLRMLDESPEKALECLTRLKYRMTPDKIQFEGKLTQIKVLIVDHSTSNIRTSPQTTGDSQRPT